MLSFQGENCLFRKAVDFRGQDGNPVVRAELEWFGGNKSFEVTRVQLEALKAFPPKTMLKIWGDVSVSGKGLVSLTLDGFEPMVPAAAEPDRKAKNAPA